MTKARQNSSRIYIMRIVNKFHCVALCAVKTGHGTSCEAVSYVNALIADYLQVYSQQKHLYLHYRWSLKQTLYSIYHYYAYFLNKLEITVIVR